MPADRVVKSKSGLSLNVRLALMLMAVAASFFLLVLITNYYRGKSTQLSRFEVELNATLSSWSTLMGAAKSIGLSEAPLNELLTRLHDREDSMKAALEAFAKARAKLDEDDLLLRTTEELRLAMEPGQELLKELNYQFDLLRRSSRGDSLFLESAALSSSVPYLFSSGKIDDTFLITQKIRGLLRAIDVFSVNFELSERKLRGLMLDRSARVTMYNHIAQLVVSLVIFTLLILFLIEIFRINAILQDLVSVRTKELKGANRGLQTALEERDMAQEYLLISGKMAAVGRVTAAIAHELNTPLAAIRSSSVYLLDTNLESLDRSVALFRTLSPEDLQFARELYMCASKKATGLVGSAGRGQRRELVAGLRLKGLNASMELVEAIETIGVWELEQEIFSCLERGGEELILVVADQIARLKATAVIYSAADRSTLTISSLANCSRNVDAQKSAPHYPIQEIKTVLDLYEEKMRGRVQVQLVSESDDMVLGYGDGLFQVWNHLVLNALQSMDYQGFLQIRLSREGEELCVRVTDSGPGIPPESQEKVFTPFFSSKKAGEGIGLGLYMSRQIIHQHSGNLSFTSEPGKTCFLVRLPIFHPV